jgi:hypothetical protein
MENKIKNPFRVLTSPREFIHERMHDARGASLWISFFLGMSYLFGKAYTFSLGKMYTLTHIIVFCLILAIPVGLVLLQITSFFIYWVGKMFNGIATFSEVYAAFTWTRVCEVFIFLGWVGMVSLFGSFAFTTSVVTFTPVPLVVILLLGTQVVFGIWESIILFQTLGEVQGFSAWIAVWNVLFAWVILFFVDLSFNWFLVRGFDWAPLANFIFS